MDHAAVGEMEPGTGDDRREEQARDEEEFGHAERGGEPQDVVHETDLAGGFAHAIGRMHHHHENDGNALGQIDPGVALFGSVGHVASPGAKIFGAILAARPVRRD